MKYQLYSKNVDVTDAFREYLDTKLSHFDKYALTIVACRVDISRDQHHRKGDVFRVEINVTISGSLLRTVEHHEDARAAIDLATDAMGRQLKRHKERSIDVKRRFSRLFKRFRQS